MAQIVQLLPRDNTVEVQYTNNHKQFKNTKDLVKVEKLQEGHVQQWGLWNNHQLEYTAHEIQIQFSAIQKQRQSAKRYLLLVENSTPPADFNTLRKAELGLAIATYYSLLAMEEQVQWYQAVAGVTMPSRDALGYMKFYYAKMGDDLRQMHNDNYDILDARNPHLIRVQGAWNGRMNKYFADMKAFTEQKFNIAFNAFQQYHALRRMHFYQQAITSEHFELSAKKFVHEYRIALRKVNLYRGAFVLLSILHFEESSRFNETYMDHYTRELDNYFEQIDGIYQTLIYSQ
jgi:hypothetical protein